MSTETAYPVRVMGLDTGIANLGWCVVDMLPAKNFEDGISVVAMGHLKTTKAHKKLNVKASDDNFERTRLIARRIDEVINDYGIVAVCAEATSFVRSATAMNKIGMCFGAVAALVNVYDLPFLQATPQEIKHAVCNDRKASKDDMQEALNCVFKGAPGKLLASLAATKREHPYDALGAVVACWDTDAMRMARATRGKATHA